MASTIRIKRSNVAGNKPSTSDIEMGEIALNTKDQKLYSSNGSVIFEMANAGALANTNSAISNLNTNLTSTNTALRTLISDRLQVANAVTTLAALTDVSQTTPTDGHVLKYASANTTYYFAAESGGGASNLADLSDVSQTTPSDGQILKYSSANSTFYFASESSLSKTTATLGSLNPDDTVVTDVTGGGSGSGVTTGKAIAMAIVFGG